MKLLLGLLFPLAAYPQVTLTGAAWFSSTPTGATSVSQSYADGYTNTIGGDQWWNLWIALNPDASLPINGPSDEQAGISIPLQIGQSYKYYIFSGGNCCTLSYSGLNLFFNGNADTPAISVFGQVNTTGFVPDASSVLSLPGNPAQGAGRSYYSSAGAVVVLTGFNWNDSATPPGDVCQPFEFIPDPGGVVGPFGSFSFQVWPAASLALSQQSGPPGTSLTLTGSGFDPDETVILYSGHPGVPPVLGTATTDSSGAFTATVRESQHPLGPVDLFATGVRSRRLAPATLNVTPALGMNPRSTAPGSSVTANLVGFGAGEIVNVYWNEPRQLLGTVTANALGSGATAITIPAAAAPGLDVVLGVGQTTKAIGLGEVRVQ